MSSEVRAVVCLYLCLAAEPLVHSVQDSVLHNVFVELLSGFDCCKLGNDCGHTQGGVVCQRHVTNLHGKRDIIKIFLHYSCYIRQYTRTICLLTS